MYMLLCIIIIVCILLCNLNTTNTYENFTQPYPRKKLAFCFLIYDKINLEDLWKIFFDGVDKNKYNIYIHYKNDYPLKYFDKYKLNNCIDTKYAHISLVKAQNVLLSEALKDKNNEHFIFVSNSCIPFKSFNHIYDDLNNKYSYFNISPHHKCFPRCNKTKLYINKKQIQKASQWCILNRKHANVMINNNDYLKWFDYKKGIPDEHCYITKIYYDNLQNEIINTRIIPTTFVNWKYSRTTHPKTYNNININELKTLLYKNHYFGRKMTNKCYDSLYNKLYVNKIKNKNNKLYK